MNIKTPNWHSALSKLHHGEADLFVSVLKETLRRYAGVPDLLAEAGDALEQLALELLDKHFRQTEHTIAHHTRLVRRAINDSMEWVAAEAALPEFARKIQADVGPSAHLNTTMVTSNHAIGEWFMGRLGVCIDLFWANGRWHIGGAHVDARSLHQLMQRFAQSESAAS